MAYFLLKKDVRDVFGNYILEVQFEPEITQKSIKSYKEITAENIEDIKYKLCKSLPKGGGCSKKLKVDLDLLALIMESVYRPDEFYFDTKTGKIINVPSKVFRALEDEKEAADLPDWKKELLPAAKGIKEEAERYYVIPTIESWGVYDLMVEFAESVENPGLQKKNYQLL